MEDDAIEQAAEAAEEIWKGPEVQDQMKRNRDARIRFWAARLIPDPARLSNQPPHLRLRFATAAEAGPRTLDGGVGSRVAGHEEPAHPHPARLPHPSSPHERAQDGLDSAHPAPQGNSVIGEKVAMTAAAALMSAALSVLIHVHPTGRTAKQHEEFLRQLEQGAWGVGRPMPFDTRPRRASRIVRLMACLTGDGARYGEEWAAEWQDVSTRSRGVRLLYLLRVAATAGYIGLTSLRLKRQRT
ncbi:hypothetical protein ACFV9D_23320 [Streptomyces sp. NPDC059875]|uniref:hypothetical protein n=1 Tax=unclassified Streptomyces TaxID=2593676 RepID=UPI0036563D13